MDWEPMVLNNKCGVGDVVCFLFLFIYLLGFFLNAHGKQTWNSPEYSLIEVLGSNISGVKISLKPVEVQPLISMSFRSSSQSSATKTLFFFTVVSVHLSTCLKAWLNLTEAKELMTSKGK